MPNTIIDLAVIDPELFLCAVGRVGGDDLGRFVVSQMKKYGIDVSGVKVSADSPTSYSNVMTEVSTGERTFFHMRGSNAEFSQDDIDINNLDCEIFHVGYILLLDALDKEDEVYGTKMARLLHDVAERGIKTSIDVVSEEGDRFATKVIPALKYCSYATMNEIESGMVTGLSPRNDDGSLNIANIKCTMEKFFEYGVKEKVIVHCSEAGFILDKSGEFTAVPSLQLPKGYIKGSVGAGDAFTAGCLYGLYKGFDDKRILEFASGAAACNLSAKDSISGMKSRADIMDMIKTLDRKELNF
ncbi:MAG: carbohydrate kinase family protein [Ruminococcaceae bacterium]|nr:carbohydrate kinase family protein [Oscillospiraceae bacterium]